MVDFNGKILKEKRVAQMMSARQLATILNTKGIQTDLVAIYRWEGGGHKPRIPVIAALAEIFNCQIRDFLS